MIQYFGYGAMIDSDVMEAVIGRAPKGEPVTVRGMSLAIQNMSQIPISAQNVLRRKWPDTFRSYSISPKPGSTVSGMLWTITEEERDIIRDWELVYLVWYEVADVTTYRKDGSVAVASTEVMKGSQPCTAVKDGSTYPALLNSKEDVLRIAVEARNERPRS